MYANQTDCQNYANSANQCGYGYFSYISDCYSISGVGQIFYSAACSDEKIKSEIETIANALEMIMKLEPVEFDWNNTFFELKKGYPRDKKHTLGFIAQEVEKILPEVVEIDLEDGYYKINYPKLNALVVEGIKEQQLFIEDINKKINELENLLK